MTADTVRVLNFVQSIMPLPASVGMKALGLERDGRLIAGLVYEGYNGVNIWGHLAAEPGSRWMTREYLRYCFAYPFDELGVKRISGSVAASNLPAQRLDEHLGFKREAVLQGAAPDGGDVILYVMRREDCRYL